MRTRHPPILLLPFLAALAAGCGEDSGTPTGPELGPSLAAGLRVIAVTPTVHVPFSPVTAPFGPANATTQTYTVTNVGTRVTSALTLTIAGTGAAAYRIEPGDDRCTGRSLATSGKNKSCTVKITFAPAEVGTFTATLSVSVAQPKAAVGVFLTGTGVPQQATIRIIAQVVGTDVSTSYVACAVGGAGGGGSCGGFSLLSGQEQMYTALSPGAYTVSANASPAGYSLQSIVCRELGPDGYTNVASTVDVSNRLVNANLQGGETLTCTFTTTQDG